MLDLNNDDDIEQRINNLEEMIDKMFASHSKDLTRLELLVMEHGKLVSKKVERLLK